MGSLPSSGSHLRLSKWLASTRSAVPAMNGSALPVIPSSKPGPVAAAVSRALAASWRTLSLPHHMALRWLSWGAALAIRFFTLMGAPPQGYVAQSKMRELDSIIEHMHTREDVYRKTIRELQEALESKDLDRKRALKRLKSAKAELESLHLQLAELQEQHNYPGGGGGSGSSGVAGAGAGSYPGGAAGLSQLDRTALHTTMAVLLALVAWFYRQECHAIQRKLVFAVLAPVMWSYVTMLLSKRPTGHPVLLYSAAWGLIGFVGAYKFSQMT